MTWSTGRTWSATWPGWTEVLGVSYPGGRVSAAGYLPQACGVGDDDAAVGQAYQALGLEFVQELGYRLPKHGQPLGQALVAQLHRQGVPLPLGHPQ